jgi:uncharacterized Zn finger protein
MKAQFDEDALFDLAGKTIFARGKAYFTDGRVEILDRGPKSVRARVTGSQVYRTSLTGAGAAFGGACSCPNFEDYGFCKHLVATALAANDTDAPASGDATDRIRKFLLTKDAPALIDLLVEHAMRDEALLRRLEMMAASAGGSDKTILSRMRKMITEATHVDGYTEYDEDAGWSGHVAEVLDAVGALVSSGKANIARQLAEHALDRIGEALGEIEDPEGEAGSLLDHAKDIHLKACQASPPDPVALARDLFAREMDDEWGTFDNAMALYADPLGETGRAEYRRLAEAAWKKTASGHAEPEPLIRLLDGFAARDGDIGKRIALRSYNLQSSWQYLALARFCLEHDHPAEALRYAEDGLKIHGTGRPDEQLVTFLSDRYVSTGNTGAALKVLWRAFDREPSETLFNHLKDIGGEEERDRAIATLRVRLAKAPGRNTWFHPADLLLRILTAETLFEEAWDIVQTHNGSDEVVLALAGASGSQYPQQALTAYARTIDKLVSEGGNRNYDAAHGLIAKMARLRGRTEQQHYISGLMIKFKAKRNFMKLLAVA